MNGAALAQTARESGRFQPSGWLWGLLAFGFICFIAGFVIYLCREEHFLAFLVIEFAGLVIAGFAAFEAARAADKTQKTEKQLVEIGLLAAETRTQFKRIFAEHLIVPLKSISFTEGKPGEVYLLLSTPAYGYGVLGDAEQSVFPQALADLNPACQMQVIFFSPDAHFFYWCNVLLWAAARNEAGEFPVTFCKRILGFRACVRYPERWKIWLVGETTVRLFAFEPQGDRLKAYVLLVDQFGVKQDQYGEAFKTRSVPILAPYLLGYVRGEDNYFDRIKRCPYSMRDGNEAALDLNSDQGNCLLDAALWDYALGRTSQPQFPDFACFHEEFRLFLEVLQQQKETAGGVSGNEFVQKLCGIVCHYFHFALSELLKAPPRNRLSDAQFTQIGYALEKLTGLTQPVNPAETSSDSSEIQSRVKNLGQMLTELQKHGGLTVNSDHRNELSDHWNEEASGKEWEYCLFLLLSSGFAESAYAQKCREA